MFRSARGEVCQGFGRCQPHGRGLRNYLTYFFVYSVRWVRTCARARTDPGTPVGHAPVRSDVFERRWPPGPVAILGSDGLAVYDRTDGWIHLWLADDWIPGVHMVIMEHEFQ